LATDLSFPLLKLSAISCCSLACACHLENFDFLAIEKDEDYYNASVKRFEELKSQGVLF